MTTKQYTLLILMSFSVFALGYALGCIDGEIMCPAFMGVTQP